ncbi:MAG: PD40 domain-containing protein [Betaproteobacteria bacterium]|nr:PD40 domain-containing protein [Betaproteobacteria bacterium]
MKSPPFAPSENDSLADDTTLRIGGFVVRADSNELEGPAGVVRLRPLLMQVLLRLAMEPGGAVTREQLINDVWSRKIVNDEVLSRAIAELRTALGDDSREPRYIETLPKVGYRLVAAVSRESVSAVPPHEPAGARSAQTRDISPPRPDVTRTAPSGKWIALTLVGVIAAVLIGVALTYDRKSIPAPSDWTARINAAAPFASDPALELGPRFSPDGRQVIYVRRAATARQSEIVIQDIVSGARTVALATAEAMSSPVFFADAARIAFWKQTSDGCEIVEYHLTEKTAKRLLDCVLRPQPRFDLSPDGKRLVFAARPRADYPSRLMMLDVAGGEPVTVTEPQPGDGADSIPRFSPDGSRIAFFRGSESHDRIWIASATAPFAAKPATSIEGLSYGLAWTGPDGPLLVAADWHGFRALNELNLQTGESKLLGARGARYPDLARDGQLVFENASYRADLRLTDADAPGKREQLLWPSTRYTNQAEFSPDGKRVVFASNRDGSEGIFVGELNGDVAGAARRMPLPEGFRYIRPHWSPDGSTIFAVRIALSASRPSQQQAIRIDAASGKHEVMTSLGNAINAVFPLSNGDLLIGEISEYAMRLIRYDSSGRQGTRLALPLVAEFTVRGNTLVYTLPQLTGATRCELDTLRCSPIPVALNDSNRFDWALGRDAIWYRGVNTDGKRALARYDLTTGKLENFDYAPTGAGSSIAASADGKRLIVMREEPPVIDLMLVRKPLP